MSRPVSTLAALLLALFTAASPGQTAGQPQPLNTDTAAEALARPAGAAVSVPRTRGSIDLQGKRFYIAEYRVLIDQGGELNAWTRDGVLLGQQLKSDEAIINYRAAPDLAAPKALQALQALVDKAWADLQVRLNAAGVVLTPAADIINVHGAIFDATEPGSSAGNPQIVDNKTGDTTRRYLVLAPTGTRLIRQVPGGIDVGNLGARVSYPSNKVEGLSLALAVNLTGLDPSSKRASSFAPGPGGGESLSPQMELGPAPSSALVHAHGQRSLVNLSEALVLAPEFARLRVASPAETGRKSALDSLLSLGRTLAGSKPQVDAVLELDGPATARLLAYSLAAGNQAIADTLKAAQGSAP